MLVLKNTDLKQCCPHTYIYLGSEEITSAFPTLATSCIPGVMLLKSKGATPGVDIATVVSSTWTTILWSLSRVYNCFVSIDFWEFLEQKVVFSLQQRAAADTLMVSP